MTTTCVVSLLTVLLKRFLHSAYLIQVWTRKLKGSIFLHMEYTADFSFCVPWWGQRISSRFFYFSFCLAMFQPWKQLGLSQRSTSTLKSGQLTVSLHQKMQLHIWFSWRNLHYDIFPSLTLFIFLSRSGRKHTGGIQ